MLDSLPKYFYDELFKLQKDTTKLLAEQEAALAERRLKAKRGPSANGATAARARAPAAGLAPDTVVNYRRRGAQLLRDAKSAQVDVWTLIQARVKTKGAWYTAKASTQVVIFERMREAKRKIDELVGELKLRKLSAAEKAELDRHISDLAYLGDALQAMPTGPVAIGGGSAGGGSTKKRRTSKSASLRGLPEDWRERVAIGLPPSTAFLWLVQAVTGCRPVELDMGLMVTMSEDKKNIKFEVAGAKVTETSGQPDRTMTYKTDEPLTRMLSNWLTPAYRERVALDRSRDAYRKIVGRVCKRLWPDRSAKTMPSVYSARHQAKSDMQALGTPKETIAQTLGHSGTGSQTHYGGSGRTSGAIAPKEASATRKVKHKTGYAPKSTPAKQDGKRGLKALLTPAC